MILLIVWLAIAFLVSLVIACGNLRMTYNPNYDPSDPIMNDRFEAERPPVTNVMIWISIPVGLMWPLFVVAVGIALLTFKRRY